MDFWGWLFRLLFGRGRKKAEPAPPRPEETPIATARPAPPPPAPPPAPAPPPPQPVRTEVITAEAPVAAPADAPAPPAPVRVKLDLAALVAQDRTPLSTQDIEAAAQRLEMEPAILRALVQIESGGAGFGPDGRPVILFDPVLFSQLTGGRFDAEAPEVSQAKLQPGGLGGSQSQRWERLARAYGLDAEAALSATSWGLFQIAGSSHRDAGAADVSSFVLDQAYSELRQLAAFENLIRVQSLADELRAKDWEAFARLYNGENGAARYAQALADAYVNAKRASASASGSFLASLVAKDMRPLTPSQIAASAERLGAEEAAVRAVLKVESRGAGFAADGRPIILYEPHVFSRLTDRKYDQSHPTISYRNWRTLPYPRTQAERWDQLAAAFALDSEAALGAASWGLFQILGSNHRACGFETASAFVSDIAISHERQLIAFEAFVRSNNILEALQRLDWTGFARVYNGPGQVETYGRLLAEAYAEAKAIV